MSQLDRAEGFVAATFGKGSKPRGSSPDARGQELPASRGDWPAMIP